MNLMAALTRSTVQSQPEIIKKHLLRSQAVLEAAELLVTPVGRAKRVNFSDIRDALSRAPLEEDFVVNGLDGEEPVPIRRTREGVILSEEATEDQTAFHLSLLDPDATIRLNAFDVIAEAALPCLPNQATWRELVSKAALTPFDMSNFFRNLRETPDTKLAMLGAAFVTRNAVENLVPSGRAYYEALIGAIPRGVPMRLYLESTLYPHLRAVFDKNPDWGWLCTEAAYQAPSMDLEFVFRGVSDEALLSALQARDKASPLAPVAGIAAALPRAAANGQFLTIAKEAMAKVIEEATRPVAEHGNEALFASLAMLSLKRISEDEEMWEAPPYWRRIAAFAHAHLLLQFIQFGGVSVAVFQEWANGARLWSGEAACLSDCWAEPSWLPEYDYFFSPWIVAAGYAIRVCQSPIGAEVFGDVQAASLNSPEGLSDFAKMWGSWPDLVGAADRASDQEDPVMDEEMSTFVAGRSPSEESALGDWMNLFWVARMKTFSAASKAAVAGWIDQIPNKPGVETLRKLELLVVAGRIAGAQPDRELADHVVDSVMNLASQCHSAALAGSSWRCLIFAAAAMTEASEREEWLELRLMQLAFSLPSGAPCGELAARIDSMERLRPISARRYGKARYMAMSAIG